MEDSIEIDYNPSQSASGGSNSGVDEEAYDDQYLEDSTTNYENGNDDDFYDNPLERKKRPDKCTKVVWGTRALVIVVLVLSAATSATLTFVFLEGDEHEDFSTTYKNNALEITTVAQQNANNIFSSIRHFAAIYTSQIRQHSSARQPEYPPSFLTLPDFESFAQNTRQVAGCKFLAYSPLLKSSSQRFEWETYSVEHQGWIHDSLVQASPDYAGHPADVLPIPDIIWRMNNVTGLPEVDTGPPPFLPLWQISPPPPPNMTSKINVNLLSSSTEFVAAADYSLQTAEPTLSKPFDMVRLFGNDSATTTASVLVEPVLSSFDVNATVLGTISAVLPWDVYFSNLLPEDSEAIIVVVESCETNHTFVLKGPQAIYMGPGDLHDHSYNSWEVFSHLILARNTADERFRSQCVHALHVFPTSELQAAHETDTPLLYTLIVMSIFIFAIVVFFIYDLVATIRQNKTKAEADRTDAIIAQIFPTMIREQLFMSGALATGGGGENKKGMDSNRTSLRDLGVRNNRRGRRPSLGSRERSSDSLMEFMQKGREAEARRKQASRAIADLYPETTIMFADIPGFTAWSSIREPTHVFMLLEAVFQTFDEIANRRRVFKVETVGDCFVAACGVPEPCSDHAVVMARFARDCMKQFHQTLLELELTLGPDTCDLGLRVGLHSGPVTAGVLRGDRARFQLFGDCMNTTARVQTTGQRDCIHVSEQTASLLTLAGKRKWLIPREDQVQAKGKGYLKTFWLKTKRISSGEGSQSQTTDFSDRSSETETDGNLSFSNNSSMTDVELMDSEAILKSMDEKLAGKRKSSISQQPMQQGINERLVMWNAELLAQLLRQIIARRGETQRKDPSSPHQQMLLQIKAQRGVTQPKDAKSLHQVAASIGHDKMVVEETAEIIELPDFDERGSTRRAADIELSPEVLEQLRDYVATIAGMYRDNPFHNFEHASHVTMSVSKLLSRIVAPQFAVDLSEIERKEQLLHDHTYGITSDPLTQFAVVLSALIHDVDHRGVPNFLLAKEDKELADTYQCKSIAEQNSVDKAWDALMDDKYEELRDCIFCNIAELKRFRQLLVNSVIATDIFDKELGTLRKNRWKKAFEEKEDDDTREDINRKATIVIEHIIQASDVSHTMQHWQVYLKWNSRLFTEMYEAFLAGRSDKDPSVGWYQGELGFFDNYIIPLAKKLKQCGVFGVSSDEYLNYAMQNRREWANKGEQVVADMVAKTHEEYKYK